MIIKRVGAALLAAGLLAIPQQPTFRAGAYTVAVYATVTDASGRLVPDLARDEFEVYDNGKRQKLTLVRQRHPADHRRDDARPQRQHAPEFRSGARRRPRRSSSDAAGRQGAHRQLLEPHSDRSARLHLRPRASCCKILRTELQEEGPTPLWNAVNVGIDGAAAPAGPARRARLHRRHGQSDELEHEQHVVEDVMKRAEEEDVMVYAIGLAGQTSFGDGPSRRSRRHGRWRRMAAGDTAVGGYGGGRPRRIRRAPAVAADRRIDPIRGCENSRRRPAAATSS